MGVGLDASGDSSCGYSDYSNSEDNRYATEVLTVAGNSYLFAPESSSSKLLFYESAAQKASTEAMIGFRPFSVLKCRGKNYLIAAGTLLVPDSYTDVSTTGELLELHRDNPFVIIKLFSIWISSCNKIYVVIEDFVNPQGLKLVRACGSVLSSSVCICAYCGYLY